MINNYEAAYRMLNHGQVSLDTRHPTFRDKLDLFFVDYDWVPLLVQESYLNSMQKRSTTADISTMAEAAEFISDAEVMNVHLRSE